MTNSNNALPKMNQKQLLEALGMTRSEAVKSFPEAGKPGKPSLTELLRDRYEEISKQAQQVQELIDACLIDNTVADSEPDTEEVTKPQLPINLPLDLVDLPPVQKTDEQKKAELALIEQAYPEAKDLYLNTLVNLITREAAQRHDPVIGTIQTIQGVLGAVNAVNNALTVIPNAPRLPAQIAQILSTVEMGINKCTPALLLPFMEYADLSDPNFGKTICHQDNSGDKYYLIQISKQHCLRLNPSGITIAKLPAI